MTRLVPTPALLILLLLCGYWTRAGLAGEGSGDQADTGSASKIRFDLHRLDDSGLQGPPDGLRAVHYEYCISDRPEAVRAVTAIDPTLEIHRGSPGRIGCTSEELLCIGHTNQPNYRAVLRRLAELPMIREICEVFFE